MWLIWLVRLVLLAIFLPLVLPWAVLFAAFTFSGLSVGLGFLAMMLLAFGVLVGLLRGVLGPLVDFVLVVMLFSILWNWPRGIQAPFFEKLKLAFRSLRNATRHQLRNCSLLEFFFCLAVVLLALVLSLASGFFHLLLSISIVLLLIALFGRWPRGPLSFERKLHIALRSLWEDLRDRFR